MDFYAKIAPLRVGGFLEVHHISTELSSDCLEASTSKGWIWGINVRSGWTSPMNLTYDVYTSRRNSLQILVISRCFKPKVPKGTSKGAVQKFRAMAVGSMFVHSEFEEMSAYIKKMEKEKREHLLLWVALEGLVPKVRKVLPLSLVMSVASTTWRRKILLSDPLTGLQRSWAPWDDMRCHEMTTLSWRATAIHLLR